MISEGNITLKINFLSATWPGTWKFGKSLTYSSYNNSTATVRHVLSISITQLTTYGLQPASDFRWQIYKFQLCVSSLVLFIFSFISFRLASVRLILLYVAFSGFIRRWMSITAQLNGTTGFNRLLIFPSRPQNVTFAQLNTTSVLQVSIDYSSTSCSSSKFNQFNWFN